MRFSFPLSIAVFTAFGALGCADGNGTPTMPSAVRSPAAIASSAAAQNFATTSTAQPPFNLEAILRGDGFGHVKYRQEKDPNANLIQLVVWVRDLAPNTTYSFQRAVDTTLDGVCTSENWLTLGQGATPYPIVTDSRGTASADLWRDLTGLFDAGTAFDIYFRVVEAGTTHVVLQSDCYRFIVRD